VAIFLHEARIAQRRFAQVRAGQYLPLLSVLRSVRRFQVHRGAGIDRRDCPEVPRSALHGSRR
jgi:hypothetical protein